MKVFMVERKAGENWVGMFASVDIDPVVIQVATLCDLGRMEVTVCDEHGNVLDVIGFSGSMTEEEVERKLLGKAHTMRFVQ